MRFCGRCGNQLWPPNHSRSTLILGRWLEGKFHLPDVGDLEMAVGAIKAFLLEHLLASPD